MNWSGQKLSSRVKALWLKKWQEENASYNDPEQFPVYKTFEEAWEVWGGIEFEGTSGLSDEMMDLTNYIIKKDPALAKAIIQTYGKAAHIGPIKVVGKVKSAAKEDAPSKPAYFVIRRK